jgi:hypothetical protein
MIMQAQGGCADAAMIEVVQWDCSSGDRRLRSSGS